MSLVEEDWEAKDGDVIANTTANADSVVTIPAGASVTVNGVKICGAAGAAHNPAPEFAEGGKSVATAFTKTANGKWTLTTFAEIANDAIGSDVSEDQIKVYSAASPKALKEAKPMEEGVTVVEKKSAVKTAIEVVAPEDAKERFF